MRKAIMILAAALAASCACAADGLRSEVIRVDLTTGTGGTNTSDAIKGYVEEVQAYVAGGVYTGTVAVAILPADGAAAYNIATNSVVGVKRWRPRVDATDTAGTALTSDPPVRYPLYGDRVRVIVTGSPTNVSWRVRVKTSDR